MKTTNTVLDKIVTAKRKRLDGAKANISETELIKQVPTIQGSAATPFFDALKTPSDTLKIIAEVKRASPSAGLLRDPFDLSEINQAYQSASSVAAISVITEEDFFQGSSETLKYIAEHDSQSKPILCKDFIFDTYQLAETKLMGADAYLLIASLLEEDELVELVDAGIALGLEPLIEVTNEEELSAALKTKARCIGVNSRDLKTFKTDKNAHELLRKIDPSYARVAESAIETAGYIEYLRGFADAALIGTYFMKAKNISESIQNLTKQGSAT